MRLDMQKMSNLHRGNSCEGKWGRSQSWLGVPFDRDLGLTTAEKKEKED